MNQEKVFVGFPNGTGQAMPPIDPSERAWVKIPSLRPPDMNALRPMDLNEISRLRERLDAAEKKIVAAQKEKAAKPQPGDRVSCHLVLTGKTIIGTVVPNGPGNSALLPGCVWVLWDRRQVYWVSGRIMPEYVAKLRVL